MERLEILAWHLFIKNGIKFLNMIRNYIIVTFRNMVRNKLFTLINIFGLSVSLACCILLFLYASRELGYDKQNKDVYRLTTDISQKDGQIFKLGSSSIPIGPAIQQQLPGVKYDCRVASTDFFGNENLISYKGNSWYIHNGYFVDSTFFKVLKYKIIAGNPGQPLANTSSVVLEKEWAKKIFGDEDPIGKMIRITVAFGPADFEVSGVYDKNAFHTHLNPSFMISTSNSGCNSFFNKDQTNWVANNMVFTYVKMDPSSDIKTADDNLNKLILKNGGEDMKQMGLNKTMDFQPVDQIHTDSQNYMVNVPGVVSIVFIRVLIMIGLLILVLACVNYINLSTAQAGNRALEVGVRKVMGVTPRSLITQFLGESFIIVFISLILSLLFAWLALPVFNRLIDQPLSFSTENFSTLVIYLAGFLLITGFVAGFYPAFYLASFKPSQVLKGRSRDRVGTSLLRKGLVVLQFVISIALISSILIISKQVNYIKNMDLGFNQKSKVIIPMNTDDAINQYDVLKQKFNSLADVQEVSGANSIPGSFVGNDLLVYKKGQTMDDAIHIYRNQIDLNYFHIMGMKLISGREFADFKIDTTKTQILVSAEAVKQLGLKPDEAPGETVYFDFQGKTYSFEIIGVVNDIHQESLHKAVDPMMYTLSDNQKYRNLIIKANMSDFQNLISELQTQWKSIVKDTPFTYFTLDDHLMVQYASDFSTFDLIKYFAIISVIISCLGLYAMSMFLAERRFREIGIRKAFGAEVSNIVIMVSSDLSKLILLAFVLSVPLSIWAMNKWLNTFVYKIHQDVMIYFWAGMISLVIGWLTISYQSFRAARTNPVKVLREE